MVVADSNVLKFKSTLNNSSKIQVTHTHDGPIFETTLAENLIIKRFLSFALGDIEYQMEMVAKSGLSKKKLDENLFASGFIIEYLKILLAEIENSIPKVQ